MFDVQWEHGVRRGGLHMVGRRGHRLRHVRRLQQLHRRRALRRHVQLFVVARGGLRRCNDDGRAKHDGAHDVGDQRSHDYGRAQHGGAQHYARASRNASTNRCARAGRDGDAVADADADA
jgi:hypothetical protein